MVSDGGAQIAQDWAGRQADKVYTLKFVLVGSQGVGKTHIASLFHKKHGGYPSVGIQFATRMLRYGEHSCVRAQIWDTAGNFPFKSVTEAYFQGAVGAMLVYDISRRSTFDDLARWLSLVRENSHESVALILVGNKSDMSSKQREVSMVEGMRFARKHGLDFMEASALHAEHVEEACRQLIMSVARYLPQEKSVWSDKERSYPLPKGWVPIARGEGITIASDYIRSHEEIANPESFDPDQAQDISTKFPEGKIGDVVKNHTKSQDTVEDTDIDTDSDSNEAAMMPPPPPPDPDRRVANFALPKATALVSSFTVSQTPPAPRSTCKIFGRSASGGSRRQRVSSDSSAAAAATLSIASNVVEDAAAEAGARIRSSGGGRGSFEPPPRAVFWYENTWTGELVSQRPLYPAGPSEACVVSQVPRALCPRTYLSDPVKPGRGAGFGVGGRRGSAREVAGENSAWSFSSFKSRGYAAAAQCLSNCFDA